MSPETDVQKDIFKGTGSEIVLDLFEDLPPITKKGHGIGT